MDEKLRFLIDYLLDEMPGYRKDSQNLNNPQILLRSLMNLRMPGKTLSPEFLRAQDEYLSAMRDEKGVVDAETLPEILPGISLWQGEITRLKCGAIVNAANSSLLGCFVPCHKCIDNAIHSAAGLQLRDECYSLMNAQGHEEFPGRAKITRGYNLPASYVIHTVGPVVDGELTDEHRKNLESCYRSCLDCAEDNGIQSVAFCCISTGEFHFPNDEAARIAVRTVKEFLRGTHKVSKIIFNVFKDCDLELYREELRP